jgi:hypothetical protein
LATEIRYRRLDIAPCMVKIANIRCQNRDEKELKGE